MIPFVAASVRCFGRRNTDSFTINYILPYFASHLMTGKFSNLSMLLHASRRFHTDLSRPGSSSKALHLLHVSVSVMLLLAALYNSRDCSKRKISCSLTLA